MIAIDLNTNAHSGSPSPRVLVVAPSAEARGGIASVVRMHGDTVAWKRFSCRLLGTFRGSSASGKIFSALWAYLRAPFTLIDTDIVHFHLAASMSVLRKVPLIWLASLFGRKIILHFHCAGAESLFEATPRRVLSFLRSRAHLVVVLSPWWKSEFERRWPGVRVEVVPNPVQTVAGKSARSDGSGAEVLFVGALSKRKGYELLLAAMADVLKEHPAVRLSIAGDGEVENAKSIARRLGIESAVRFSGWVSGNVLEGLYKQAQILSLPSYAEGVPLAVLDAMAHGLAVVTTPVGGIPDLIVDGVNGVLVPTGNAVALSSAILSLLRHPDERVRMGQAARETVHEAYGIARISDILEQLYLSLYERTGPAPERVIRGTESAIARSER